jgi:hypothetical protein
MRERGLTLEVPMDGDGAVADRYKVQGIPTSLLIDRDGVVRTVTTSY